MLELEKNIFNDFLLQEDKDKSKWHFTQNIRAESYKVVEKFVE